MVTGSTGDSGIPATSVPPQAAWEGGEMRRMGRQGHHSCWSPRAGSEGGCQRGFSLRDPRGQIHRRGGGNACGQPGTEHSRVRILGQDPSLHCWALHLRSTRKPWLQLPARLPDLPPHSLQPPPRRVPGDAHLYQPGPLGSRVLPVGSAPPAPEQPPSPSRRGVQPACPSPTPALFTRRVLGSVRPAG